MYVCKERIIYMIKGVTGYRVYVGLCFYLGFVGIEGSGEQTKRGIGGVGTKDLIFMGVDLSLRLKEPVRSSTIRHSVVGVGQGGSYPTVSNYSPINTTRRVSNLDTEVGCDSKSLTPSLSSRFRSK